MYKISEYSNKILNFETGEIFEHDDRLTAYNVYADWMGQGNTPETVNFFEGEELQKKQKRALEIDLDFTKRISDLMAKHTEKFIEALELGETYVIPQIAKDERQSLKDECRALIFQETGITDYSYRQSIPKLATFNINS